MITLTDVSVTYPDGFVAVTGVNLSVSRGEIVALTGPSGSGKSTLLRAVAGLVPVSSGAVAIDGHDQAGIPPHRRGVGMVFQNGQLFPHYSVGGNIAYGLPRRQRNPHGERVNELLELVGLSGFNDRDVATLSGGQAQRVALARTLAPQPRVVLFDEPLSSLDADLKRDLAADIRRIVTQVGETALYVTHDNSEAEIVADRVVALASLQSPEPH